MSTYFSADYFSADYFNDEWWTKANTRVIQYFSANYFSANYFGAEYFSTTGAFSGIRPTLADFSTAFVGAFAPPVTFLGTIAKTLEDFDANFSGEAVHTQIFGVTVDFGTFWQSEQIEPITSSFAVTLEALSPDISGTFRQATSFEGPLSSELDDVSSDFDGTNVVPGTFTGSFGDTLEDLDIALGGVFVDPAAVSGDWAAILDDWSAVFSGTHDSGAFSGAFSDTLEAFTADWNGIYADAGVIIGPLASVVSVNGIFQSTFVGDTTIRSESSVGRRHAVGTERATSRGGRGRARTRRGRIR